jgi:hypothetical protein
MRAIAAALLLIGALGASAAGAQPCTSDPDAATLESERYVLSYRSSRIEVGKHFTVELLVCPKGMAPPPESVRVDAQMPEHRHGMNYRPSVTALEHGRYRAEGLLFHMPGRWEFVFELRAAGKLDRLTHAYTLR